MTSPVQQQSSRTGSVLNLFPEETDEIEAVSSPLPPENTPVFHGLSVQFYNHSTQTKHKPAPASPLPQSSVISTPVPVC